MIRPWYRTTRVEIWNLTDRHLFQGEEFGINTLQRKRYSGVTRNKSTTLLALRTGRTGRNEIPATYCGNLRLYSIQSNIRNVIDFQKRKYNYCGFMIESNLLWLYMYKCMQNNWTNPSARTSHMFVIKTNISSIVFIWELHVRKKTMQQLSKKTNSKNKCVMAHHRSE